jgi:hypothetical protein
MGLERLWIVVALGTLTYGCSTGSGGSGSGADGASSADLDEFCAALCSREERCDGLTQDCMNTCPGDIDQPGNFRKDFFDAYTACLNSAACDVNEDDCLDQAVTTIYPNWADDPLLQRCFARQDECASFSDDFCGGALFTTAPARQKFAACLDQACESVAACFDELF